MDEPIRLLIATSMHGGWDLSDLIISECRKYNINIDDLKKHLIILQNPQQITDFDINVMYNVGDIGFNTCDGEGFGLCNFEQAGVGVPQIVPNIGGFKDFFVKGRNALMIDPKWTYYCDHSRDYVAGEAEMCDINDYVEALEFYYKNRNVIEQHGKNAREHITENYKWNDKGEHLYNIIVKETKGLVEEVETKVEEVETKVEDDGLMIIDGGEEKSKDINLDEMSMSDMKELLKKMLKN